MIGNGRAVHVAIFHPQGEIGHYGNQHQNANYLQNESQYRIVLLPILYGTRNF